MAQLILLDDESELREELTEFLQELGFEVIEAESIQAFRHHFELQACDIAIIDRMLPDGDGMTLVKELREAGERCGIVLFTARNASEERISGYSLGADHYLTKPIRLDEIGAIVQSLARRIQATPNWELNTASSDLRTPSGHTLKLTGLEAAFLMTMSQQPGKPVSRRTIVEALGKNFCAYDPRNLDALVKRLRDKVNSQGDGQLPLKTVHGTGYVLTAPFALTAR